jgi:dTDP-4-amino-4,6-dideoxygalactose transaminase
MNQDNKRIYLSSPHMSGHEMKYINEAFKENWVAPLGPNVDAFEQILADYCGVRHAAALSSGTSAIHLSLIMLGIKPGDEVIASTFTFSATINPIVYLGATPVLIDSEPHTWNMDPYLLEKAIKERRNMGSRYNVKAIIVVHLYGMPSDIESIMKIANKYEIPVIEDAAEALGSRYQGKPLGSFGKMGILSFNGNKIITTSGGGALVSNDEELIKKARFLSTQARDKAPYYQHTQIGYNYRMSNILAGIGRGQMEVIDERVKKRRENFQFYRSNLEKYKGISFLEEPDISYFSNRWLTCLLVDPSITGTTHELIQSKLENRNIETRPLWKPMHLQPVFEKCPAYLNGTSQYLFNNGLCIPSGSNLSETDRQNVCDSIIDCIKS